MTKLSETKHGERFTVEMTRVDTTGSGDWANIRFNDGPLIFVHISEADKIEVIKLPDPVRDLVKGEIITLGGSQITGEYLGKGWVWWSNEGRPHPLPASATTEFYKVLEK